MPERKLKPRSPSQAALGRAVEQVIAERRGISQEWVAKKAGLDVRQVNAIICGQANPTYRTLLRLCDGLRIPPSELMRRVEALRRSGPADEWRPGTAAPPAQAPRTWL
jgi:transcriptional regulator with XRE-family HTH domain